MALISIKRNVDLQPGLNAPAVFNCSQSDKGTTIMLGLMNGGNDYTVPSGVTITIRGSRSNGAVFTPVSATFSGSTVSFTLTEEMTDTAGPTLCEAVLEQGNNVLGTANFIINVEGSPMGADVPPVFTDAAWAWMLGKLTTETVPALGDDVISSIQGKVDKSQGSTNAKKFLRVNTSGNVSLASTDKTLSVADQIADAKETGDQIRALDAEIDGAAATLGGSISTLNGITTDLQSSKLDKNQGTSNAGKTMVVDSSGNIVPGDALVLKANESTIAPEFDSSTSYTAGSYVYKNGVLYRFTADHTGAWTGSDAETVTVGGELTRLDNGSGSGLTEDVKVALLACFEKVAWIDEDGQDYYDALYSALYPPADLVSISAVYTQSGTVYNTDTLDSLKTDLVVTAHMSDSTTRTVTTYTLSGTLTEGTSIITVSYGGKTTTFNVTVTATPPAPLYPLENGSHTFSYNDRTLTVTNGNHFVFTNPNATASSTGKGAYINLSTVSENDTSAVNVSNVNLTDTLFTIPAGASVVFEVKNISFTCLSTGTSTHEKYAIAIRSGTTSVFSTGDKFSVDTLQDITVTENIASDTNITCVFAYISNRFSSFEADISLTVNGDKWI